MWSGIIPHVEQDCTALSQQDGNAAKGLSQLAQPGRWLPFLPH